MVGYYNAYKGSTKTPVIYAGNKIVKKVYKGSELIYQIGFATFTKNAGTSLFAWTVPPGVKKIHVDCVASRGVLGAGDRTDKVPGYGGRVQCDVSVTGGQVLYITVGAIPSNWTVASYNASDIRIGGTGYGNRIVIAGGGGSGKHTAHKNYGGSGGNGGGLVGASGESNSRGTGGTGGTQSAGGTGGGGYDARGEDGTWGMGGSNTRGGGAGGAGLYGGGAGGFGGTSGTYGSAGGGGGSSYTNGTYCSNVIHTQGYRNGAGYVTISYIEV